MPVATHKILKISYSYSYIASQIIIVIVETAMTVVKVKIVTAMTVVTVRQL